MSVFNLPSAGIGAPDCLTSGVVYPANLLETFSPQKKQHTPSIRADCKRDLVRDPLNLNTANTWAAIHVGLSHQT
jgi:hypothetical protein